MTDKPYRKKYFQSDYYKQFRFHAFGHTWNSIKACCKHYNVCYSSMFSYRNRHGCTTEEAITHYINLQKKGIFYFKKIKWTDLYSCCVFYGLNYKSLQSYMWSNHVTQMEALQHYYDHHISSSFKFQKVKYKNFAECCRAYGLRSASVIALGKRKGYSRRQALIESIKFSETRKFIFRNSEYETFSACCRDYGFHSPDTISSYAKRHSVSKQEALEHYLKSKPQFLFHEVHYNSLQECCETYGINYNSVKTYMFRAGEPPEKALEYYIVLYHDHLFEYDGITYQDLSTCCEKYGINPKAVWNRAWRKDSSLKEAFQHCLNAKENNTYFEYMGKKYYDIPSCCADYNINPQSVHSYLFRNHSNNIPEAIDYIVKITRKKQFIWTDGTIYKSLPVFCKEKQISPISVRDYSRKKEVSLQEAALHYIERKYKIQK